MSLCNCRLCSYDREFAKHLALIPESEREFFEGLKSLWEHADADAEWYRSLAIADSHPKGGDAKQAPSLMSGGGAATQQSHKPHPRTD